MSLERGRGKQKNGWHEDGDAQRLISGPRWRRPRLFWAVELCASGTRDADWRAKSVSEGDRQAAERCRVLAHVSKNRNKNRTTQNMGGGEFYFGQKGLTRTRIGRTAAPAVAAATVGSRPLCRPVGSSGQWSRWWPRRWRSLARSVLMNIERGKKQNKKGNLWITSTYVLPTWPLVSERELTAATQQQMRPGRSGRRGNRRGLCRRGQERPCAYWRRGKWAGDGTIRLEIERAIACCCSRSFCLLSSIIACTVYLYSLLVHNYTRFCR